MKNELVHIVGGGRVGRTLGRLLRETGRYHIGWVVNRTDRSACAAVRFIGAGEPRDSVEGMPPAAFCLVTVPDDAIAAIDENIRRDAQMTKDALVFHTSGVHGVSVLTKCAEAGMAVAALHPLASFADPAVLVSEFAGVPCAVSAADNVIQRVVELATTIGGDPFIVNDEGKSLYHAGAVSASNFIVAVMALARNLLVASGVEEKRAIALAGQLARQTIGTVEQLGPTNALTGPVARGDVKTIAMHVDELRKKGTGASDADDDYHVYLALSRYLTTAVRASSGDDETKSRLLDMLTGFTTSINNAQTGEEHE